MAWHRQAIIWTNYGLFTDAIYMSLNAITGDPLHSRALAHSRAPLFTQPCPHCSHSRAPGEQWARLCVFTLQGCVQTARLCRGSPVAMLGCHIQACCHTINLKRFGTNVISDYYFITCTTEIFHSSVVVFIPPLIITDTCEIYSPGWCTYWSVKMNRISWHPTSECASKSYKIILMAL